MTWMLASLIMLAALTPQELDDLRTIIVCGSLDMPTRICCRAAEQAKRTADRDALAVLDAYLRRNCQGPRKAKEVTS
jgi:hypothetical protein